MKKRISVLIVLVMLLSLSAFPAFAADINLEINGQTVQLSVAPVIENGTTLVPLRIISQNLGSTVDWDGETQGITISNDNKTIKLNIGSTLATVNGETKTLSLAPKIINSTTMVPIRFVSENLDAYVNWDQNSRTVQVNKTGEFAKPTSTPTTTITTGQKNALAKAKDYLDIMPFSYSGLIEQLEYEGFTHDQAVYGVDNCKADWNAQAALKAKDYLDTMAMSRDRLISQLKYEGFSDEQVAYGVTAVNY